jgi:hypothetical protein
MPAKTHPPERRRKNQPQVGIFWLVGGKLVIDSVPLSEAEPYGDHMTYPRSHLEVWTKFQQKGTVPSDIEYEEAPRGRVIYNAKTGRFSFLADKCILRDKIMLTKIMSELNLPNKKTDGGDDSHYRCSACLRGNAY